MTVGSLPPSIITAAVKRAGPVVGRAEIKVATALERVVGKAEGCREMPVRHGLTAGDCNHRHTPNEFSSRAYTGPEPGVQAAPVLEKKKHEQLVGRQTDSFDHAFGGQEEFGT